MLGKSLKTFAFAATLTIPSVLPAHAAERAEPYPVRPVRVIVPQAPGGGIDFMARLFGARLSEALRQSFVVDNRTGAGSTIGTAIVARAAPDGHTLLFNSISMAFNATLFNDLPYDTLKDFAPVAVVANTPNVLVVAASGSFKSVQDVIRSARANPGKLNYGSGGIGGSDHVCMEYFLAVAGIKAVNVAYKGAAPALVDLAAGKIDLSFAPMASSVALVKAGRLRALGVSTAKRTPLAPDLPTMAESGLAGFDYATWYGVWAPARTPAPVLQRLSEEMRQALQLPELRERLAVQGAEPAWRAVDDTTAFVRAEVARWAPIIRTFGAQPK